MFFGGIYLSSILAVVRKIKKMEFDHIKKHEVLK